MKDNSKTSDVRRLPNAAPPRYVAVKKHILEQARAGAWPDNRLPSEEALCELLSVSRATVREALGLLRKEGFVSKRHGVGNMLHTSVLNAPLRFDLDQNLGDMLRHAGLGEPGLTRSALYAATGGSAVEQAPLVERLVTPRPWLLQRAAHTVGQKPAILTYNVFAADKFGGSKGGAQAQSPLPAHFDAMVFEATGESIAHSINAFLPFCNIAEVAEHFGLEAACPAIMWHQQHYGTDDTLLCESAVFFNPRVVTLHSLLKWV